MDTIGVLPLTTKVALSRAHGILAFQHLIYTEKACTIFSVYTQKAGMGLHEDVWGCLTWCRWQAWKVSLSRVV